MQKSPKRIDKKGSCILEQKTAYSNYAQFSVSLFWKKLNFQIEAILIQSKTKYSMFTAVAAKKRQTQIKIDIIPR